MNMLKALPSIFWYFLTWQRVQLVLGVIGLISFAIAALMTLKLLVGGAELNAYGGVLVFIFLGLGFIFLTPLFTAGLAFRSLVSQRQYMVAPHSGQATLLALLLFTLMAPLLPYIIFLVTHTFSDNNRGPFPFTTIIVIFNFSSIFHFLCQTSVPKSGMMPLALLPWLAVIFMLNLPDGTLAPLFHPVVTVLVLLIVIYCWAKAFSRMKSSRPLKPISNNPVFNAFTDGEKNTRVISIDFSATHSISPEKSLYYSILTNTKSQVGSVIVRVYLFPVLILFFWSMLFYLQEKPFPDDYLPQVYLALCGFLSIVTALRHGELITRSRLLWLRLSSQRTEVWLTFDRIILKDLIMTWVAISVLALIALMAGYLSPLQAISYLVTVISISFYFTWLAVFCSMRKGLSASPTFLVGMMVATALILQSMFNGLNEVSANLYQDLVPVSLFMLIAGIIFRQLAAHTFTNIDWLQIKPTLLRGRGRN